MFAQPRTKQSQHWSANQHPMTMNNTWCVPSQKLRLGVFAIALSIVLALTGQGAPKTSPHDVNRHESVIKVQIDPACSPFAALTECFNEIK